jgi:hypothetical protein
MNSLPGFTTSNPMTYNTATHELKNQTNTKQPSTNLISQLLQSRRILNCEKRFTTLVSQLCRRRNRLRQMTSIRMRLRGVLSRNSEIPSFFFFFFPPPNLDDLGQNGRILHDLVEGKRQVRIQIDILALHFLPRLLQKLLKISLFLELQQALSLTVVSLCIIAIDGQFSQEVSLNNRVRKLVFQHYFSSLHLLLTGP